MLRADDPRQVRAFCAYARLVELDKADLAYPTVLANVKPHSSFSCEETFGPVVSVIEVNDEGEAVAAATVRMSKETLQKLIKTSSKSISEIMREAIGPHRHLLDCGPGPVTVGLLDSMRITHRSVEKLEDVSVAIVNAVKSMNSMQAPVAILFAGEILF